MPAVRADFKSLTGVTGALRRLGDPLDSSGLGNPAMSHLLLRCEQGRAEARQGRRALRLGEGSWAFLPRGTRYRVERAGREAAQLLCCWFPDPPATDAAGAGDAGDGLERRVVDHLAERAFAGEHLIALGGDADRVGRELLRRIAQEWSAQRYGALAMTRALLAELLVAFARDDALGAALRERQVLPERAEGGLAQALALIEARHAGRLSVAELAAVAKLSPGHFHARFRAAVGTTPQAYITRYRRLAAQRLLVDTDLPIAEVAAAAGFASQSRMYEVFKRAHGEAPARLRRRMLDCMDKARRLLREPGAHDHAAIAAAAGFADEGEMTRLFETRLGMTPRSYARGPRAT